MCYTSSPDTALYHISKTSISHAANKKVNTESFPGMLMVLLPNSFEFPPGKLKQAKQAIAKFSYERLRVKCLKFW